MEYDVILPVYNEAPTLEGVLDRLASFPGARPVVVDDGSTDGTSALLERRRDVTVLRHAQNQGYGASLIDGFAYVLRTGRPYCLTLDADDQHEPAYIPCFLEKLADFDVVSGSRYLDRSLWKSEPPPDRLEVNRLLTARIREATGYALTDSFCGFKGYRTEALAKLHLTERSYGFPVQFWIHAARAGLTVTECAVPLVYRDYSRNFKNQYVGSQERLARYLEIFDREVREAGGIPALRRASGAPRGGR